MAKSQIHFKYLHVAWILYHELVSNSFVQRPNWQDFEFPPKRFNFKRHASNSSWHALIIRGARAYLLHCYQKWKKETFGGAIPTWPECAIRLNCNSKVASTFYNKHPSIAVGQEICKAKYQLTVQQIDCKDIPHVATNLTQCAQPELSEVSVRICRWTGMNCSVWRGYRILEWWALRVSSWQDVRTAYCETFEMK